MSEALDNDKGYVQPDDEFGKKAFTMSVKDPIGDGLAKFDVEAIKNTSQGRCPISLKQGTCHPWIPVDR